MLPLLFCATLLCAPQIAPSGGVLASWKGGDVRQAEFERFLGSTSRNRPTGNDALRHLVQLDLVEREASSRNLQADPALVDSRLARLEAQMADAGFELDQVLAQRRLNRTEFRHLLAMSLLHEMMVRSDREMPANAEVPPELLNAWSSERMEALLSAATEAPPGFALKVDSWAITIEELGATIYDALPNDRRCEDLRQLAVQQILADMATERGWTLTDDILETEVAWRRKRVEESPSFQGMSYEQLLAGGGSSLEAVRRSAELRAAGHLRLLARERFDLAWLATLSETQRTDYLDRLGGAREIGLFLLHATPNPEGPLDLSPSDAAEELARHRAASVTPAAFLQLAGRMSEHEPSRRQGGVLGWVHRKEEGVDPAICAAAFQAEPGTVFGPFPTRDGQALICVLATRPEPTDEELLEGIRRDKHIALKRAVLEESGFQLHIPEQ